MFCLHNALERRPTLLEGEHTCCLDGNRELLRAATIGDYRAIRGLSQCPNVDINTDDGKGRTPLYYASWIGYKEAVKALLDVANIEGNKGIYFNGQTAFSIAAKKGHFDIMRLLIKSDNINVNKGWFHDRWPSLHRISMSELSHIATDSSSGPDKGKSVGAFQFIIL